MKKIAIAFIGIGLLACASKKDSMQSSKSAKAASENIVIANARTGEFAKENDPFTIDTAYIQGNQLFIDVTYGGGCKDHQFELIGSPVIAKSYPAQRAIQLVHTSNGDLCKALVKKTVQVDVSSLTDNQKDGHVIHYNLDGYKPRLEHTYTKVSKVKS